MATKDSMIEEIVQFFNNFESDFRRCGIPSEKFFRWLEKMQDYPSVRKAYNYCFKGKDSLMARVHNAQYWFNKLNPDLNYELLSRISPRHSDVLRLKGHFADVLIKWHNRPDRDKRKVHQ